MPKSQRLPERPKPPSIDQIAADIKGASDDDVVFSGRNVTVSRDSTPVNEPTSQILDKDALGHGDETSGSPVQDIGETYLRTLELLNVVEHLKKTPDELKQQYEQLEKLGDEVTEAINELKESASTIKTVKHKKPKKS